MENFSVFESILPLRVRNRDVRILNIAAVNENSAPLTRQIP